MVYSEDELISLSDEVESNAPDRVRARLVFALVATTATSAPWCNNVTGGAGGGASGRVKHTWRLEFSGSDANGRLFPVQESEINPSSLHYTSKKQVAFSCTVYLAPF